MPDYASILRRSISALPDPSPPMREAVYQRARAALARQLTAVDPPLSTREIETQHQELEDAVARLEADFAPDDPEDQDQAAPVEDYYSPPPTATSIRPQPIPGSGDRSARESHYETDHDEGEAEEEDDFEADDEPRSRLPLLGALLAVILVVGGLGAYAYSQQDRIIGLFGGGPAETEVVATEAPPVPVVASPPEDDLAQPVVAPDKSADRLTNGETPSEEPAPFDDPAADPPPAEPGGETTAALQPQDPADQSVQGLVAQRAIFYMQGKEGSPGKAMEGSVTWAEVTRDNAPAIQATLRLNDMDAATTVTIFRNNDDTLPASHLVEVQFTGSLGSSPIERVPALVLKQTEQARGQPLAGAAVPVTDQLFWIALSSDDEQITRNIQLLREGSWFDIPITFADESRALLTFEKGIPGDKVFETVMSGWTPG